MFKKTISLVILFFILLPVKYLVAAPSVQESIIGLYTAYYNRAPDQGGFNFWNQQAASTGDIATTLLMISEGFSQHPQYIQDYPSSDTTTQFVTKIYNNILNRAPDAEGLVFWVTALDNGLPKAKFIVTYVNDVLAYSGTHPDGIKSKQMFSNKVTIGQCFIDALGAESNGEPNSLAYTRSIEVLSGITEDNTTMGLAVNKIKSYLPPNTELPNSCPKGSPINIVINNPKLQACLNEQLGHPPSQTELQNLTSFTCKDKGLVDSDITELGQLTTLIYLNLNSEINMWKGDDNGNLNAVMVSDTPNRISDISPLSSLTQLQYLNLLGNQINDISPFNSLTQLQYLELRANQVSDISPLSSLIQLQYLFLQDNPISDISPLSPLTQLQTLQFWISQISDISPLSSLIQLKHLSLTANQVTDISALSSLTQLEMLFLGGNQISDVSPLSSLTKLRELYIHSNQISDISPLSSLTQLQKLNLEYNCITDFSPISFVSSVTGKDNQNPTCQ